MLLAMWTLPMLSKLKGLPPLVLRLMLGACTIYFRSLHKLQPDDWDFGQKWVADNAGAAPDWLLYVGVWVEFLAAAALVLGLLTRWSALALAAIMVVLLFWFHGGMVTAMTEGEILYGGAALVLAILGPGSLSLDRLFFGKAALE